MPLATTLTSEMQHPDTRPARPLRCVVMDSSGADRASLMQVAAASRHPIEIVETASITEARSVLQAGRADVVVLNSQMPDGDGLDFARELSAEARMQSVPLIVVSGETSTDGAVRALRSGAADYLAKDDLTTDVFDHAIESALDRTRFREADQSAIISNLSEENETLRRVTLRNMRLMKGQAMPLLAFAWRTVSGEPVDSDQRQATASKLAKLTRNLTGLIDDTVITAATHRANEVAEPLDLNSIVREIIEDEGLSDSAVHLSVRELPWLTARRSHLTMLFEELLVTSVRSGRLGQIPEVEVGASKDPDGNPIIWFREHGLRLSARKQMMAQRFSDLIEQPADIARDEHSWSLCQRLAEKNQGRFKISENDEEGSTVMIRFPREMLVGPGR